MCLSDAQKLGRMLDRNNFTAHSVSENLSTPSFLPIVMIPWLYSFHVIRQVWRQNEYFSPYRIVTAASSRRNGLCHRSIIASINIPLFPGNIDVGRNIYLVLRIKGMMQLVQERKRYLVPKLRRSSPNLTFEEQWLIWIFARLGSDTALRTFIFNLMNRIECFGVQAML